MMGDRLEAKLQKIQTCDRLETSNCKRFKYVNASIVLINVGIESIVWFFYGGVHLFQTQSTCSTSLSGQSIIGSGTYYGFFFFFSYYSYQCKIIRIWLLSPKTREFRVWFNHNGLHPLEWRSRDIFFVGALID